MRVDTTTLLIGGLAWLKPVLAEAQQSGMSWNCADGTGVVLLSGELVVPFNPTGGNNGLAFWAGLGREHGIVQPGPWSNSGNWFDISFGPPSMSIGPSVNRPVQHGDHVYFSLATIGKREIISQMQVNNDGENAIYDVWQYSEDSLCGYNAISEERMGGDSQNLINHLWRNITVVHTCGQDICTAAGSGNPNIYAVDNPTMTHDDSTGLTTCHYDHVFFQPLNEPSASATRTAWSAMASAASVELNAAAARPTWDGNFAKMATTNILSETATVTNGATSSFFTVTTAVNYDIGGSAPTAFAKANANANVNVNASPTSSPTSFVTSTTSSSSSSATPAAVTSSSSVVQPAPAASPASNPHRHHHGWGAWHKAQGS